MITYFDRQGKEISPAQWQHHYQDRAYKQVKKDETEGYIVMTVWLGINHIMFDADKSRLFQTVILKKNNNNALFQCYQEFLESEEKALECHETVLKSVEAIFANRKIVRYK